MGAGVSYCSDGTIDGINDPLGGPIPADGDYVNSCQHDVRTIPVTIEVDLNDVQPGTSFCAPIP